MHLKILIGVQGEANGSLEKGFKSTNNISVKEFYIIIINIT